jgi:PRTRC genetic system protein A
MSLVPIVPIEKSKVKDVKPVYPEADNCFLLGKNGVFHQVKNDFYEVIHKVDGVPGLDDVETKVKLTVQKLPVELLRKAEAFLIAAWKKHDGESVIILAYNLDKKEWKLLIPPQKGSSSSVEYDITKVTIPKGFEIFGTIHSHPTFNAFHSGTDDKDEFKFDGLHITVGHINTPNHSYSVRWILANKSYVATIPDAVEGVKEVDIEPEWLDRVEKKDFVNKYTGYSHLGHHYSGYDNHGYSGYSDFGDFPDHHRTGFKDPHQHSSGAETQVFSVEERIAREARIKRLKALWEKNTHELTTEEFNELSLAENDADLMAEILSDDVHTSKGDTPWEGYINESVGSRVLTEEEFEKSGAPGFQVTSHP